MNFFRAQDDAKRKTWRLAALFAAAVGSLIVLTNLLLLGVYRWTTDLRVATSPDATGASGRYIISEMATESRP